MPAPAESAMSRALRGGFARYDTFLTVQAPCPDDVDRLVADRVVYLPQIPGERKWLIVSGPVVCGTAKPVCLIKADVKKPCPTVGEPIEPRDLNTML
jgi:hypothetical protein